MESQSEIRFHCVGCGGSIPWNGKGIFAYTCRCGGTVFATEEEKLALPASLVIRVHEKRELPHLDYYVGISDYISEEKARLIVEMEKLGATWSWKCAKCKDKLLERTKYRVQRGLLKFGLHPELKALIA